MLSFVDNMGPQGVQGANGARGKAGNTITVHMQF